MFTVIKFKVEKFERKLANMPIRQYANEPICHLVNLTNQQLHNSTNKRLPQFYAKTSQ